MARRYEQLQSQHIEFIKKQHIFFVATAGAEGRINLSPKGMDSLRVLDSHTIAWLNYTGSGNETSVHVQDNGRMTIMFCSFEKEPMIMRLYGQAKVIHPRDSAWQETSALFKEYIATRQFFILDVDLVQTSCGFSVPFFEYQGERELLVECSEKKGKQGIEEFWQERNQISLDGLETNIIKKN